MSDPALRVGVGFAFGYCAGNFAATGARWALVAALVLVYVRVLVVNDADES